MKALILAIVIAATAPLSAFADNNFLSVEGMTEVKGADLKAVVNALIVANGNSTAYGNCLIDRMANGYFQVFVNYDKIDPIIIAVSDTHWLKITSETSMTQIVSMYTGKYVWGKGNRGTLVKPDIYDVRIVSTSENCKPTQN